MDVVIESRRGHEFRALQRNYCCRQWLRPGLIITVEKDKDKFTWFIDTVREKSGKYESGRLCLAEELKTGVELIARETSKGGIDISPEDHASASLNVPCHRLNCLSTSMFLKFLILRNVLVLSRPRLKFICDSSVAVQNDLLSITEGTVHEKVFAKGIKWSKEWRSTPTRIYLVACTS